MRIVVLSNPEAGRGGAGPAAEAFASFAEGRGHEVRMFRTRELGGAGLSPHLAGASGLVVFGGDGSVHRALPALIESGVPVCQAPLGTENLFSRARGSFGVDACAGLLRLVEKGRVRAIDAARAGTGCFALMCGIGPDATVVHRLASRRRGAISRWSYAGPLLREALAGRPPRLTVSIDGSTMVSAEPGQLVVANSREYGARLNPAHKADDSDGVLDALFVPARLSISLLARVGLGRIGIGPAFGHALYRRGRRIIVESHEPRTPIQQDGDPAGHIGAGERAAAIEIEVLPGVLRVFEPPGPR